jgi:hypothetical protein
VLRQLAEFTRTTRKNGHSAQWGIHSGLPIGPNGETFQWRGS